MTPQIIVTEYLIQTTILVLHFILKSDFKNLSSLTVFGFWHDIMIIIDGYLLLEPPWIACVTSAF